MKILFPLIICFVSVSPALAQDAQSRTQTQESNKAAMLRFYQEVWDKGNVAVVDEIFATTYLPHVTTAVGRLQPEKAEEQKKIAAEFRSYFSEFSFIPDFMLAEGDKVTARWTCRAKPKGLIGLLANERIEFSGINVFRFENGKVVEIWNHRDDLGAYQQFGLLKFQFAVGVLAGVVLSFALWLSVRLLKRFRRKTAALPSLPRSATEI